MRIDPTRISGVFVVQMESSVDDRGSFTRVFDADVFAASGLDPVVAQSSVSRNRETGTLRGMHIQRTPYSETKLIRCTAGAIFDVVVDTRRSSPTYGHWCSFELVESGDRAVVLSPGIAHGFLTLTPEAEVTYQMSRSYQPEFSAGFRWNDTSVGIEWPSDPLVISERDRELPLLDQMNDWNSQ